MVLGIDNLGYRNELFVLTVVLTEVYVARASTDEEVILLCVVYT
jgi:hypothetical protein